MLKNAFLPQNRRFTIFALGLLPLLACMLILMGVAGQRVLEHERDLREQRRALTRHYTLWRQQNITDYTVTYTNTGISQCQNVTMVVEDNTIRSIDTLCNNAGYSYYGYIQVRSMGELYAWLDSYAFNDILDRNIRVEYHPELHYITRLVIDDEYAASVVEIRYENLKESQSTHD